MTDLPALMSDLEKWVDFLRRGNTEFEQQIEAIWVAIEASHSASDDETQGMLINILVGLLNECSTQEWWEEMIAMWQQDHDAHVAQYNEELRVKYHRDFMAEFKALPKLEAIS